MATKHLQTVIDKNGVKRVSQYGQWDGYPAWQGKNILSFLRYAALGRYQKELMKIREVTIKEAKRLNNLKNPYKKYPYLSRDCGSKIHQMILNGEVKFVVSRDEQEERGNCDAFYTIDFSKDVFTSEYRNVKQIYSLKKLPTIKQYLKDMGEIK